MIQIFHSGSKGQKDTGSLILDPDPQHCALININIQFLRYRYLFSGQLTMDST
jgi:hypothetical protein